MIVNCKGTSIVYKATLSVDVGLSLPHINFFKYRNTTFNDMFLILFEIVKQMLCVLGVWFLFWLIFFLEYVKTR